MFSYLIPIKCKCKTNIRSNYKLKFNLIIPVDLGRHFEIRLFLYIIMYTVWFNRDRSMYVCAMKETKDKTCNITRDETTEQLQALLNKIRARRNEG